MPHWQTEISRCRYFLLTRRLPSALCFALVGTLCLWVEASSLQDSALASTLECHKRVYNYKVTKSDSAGRVCWDIISVMSCWGRCDSNEVSHTKGLGRDGLCCRRVSGSALWHMPNDRALNCNVWHFWKVSIQGFLGYNFGYENDCRNWGLFGCYGNWW